MQEYSEIYKNYNGASLNSELRIACEKNNMPLVEFLLTSTNTKKADIEAQNGYPISAAAFNGSIELLNFLLNSPSLEVKADIHSNFDNCFKVACHQNQLEILKFLILTQKIELTKQISLFLNRYKDSSIKETIEKANVWFANRSVSV